MSKKKKQNHFKETQFKLEQAKKKQQEAIAKLDFPIDPKTGRPLNVVPFDPVKHKNHVLMYKKGGVRPMWIPPASVKGYRTAGWKTQAEVDALQEKWIRKHPNAVQTIKDEAINDVCPECSGNGRLVLAENDVIDCPTCDGTGKLAAIPTKSIVCPLCSGDGHIWGKCCDGHMCGCEGKPVDGVICSLCQGTGTVLDTVAFARAQGLSWILWI